MDDRHSIDEGIKSPRRFGRQALVLAVGQSDKHFDLCCDLLLIKDFKRDFFPLLQLIVRIIRLMVEVCTIDEAFLAEGAQCNKLVNDLLHFTRRGFCRFKRQSHCCS